MYNQLTEKAKDLINSNRLYEAENILLGLKDKCSVFELAKIRKIQGRTREAEQLYLKALSMPSETKDNIDSVINIELGRIYASVGKIEEAEAKYKKGEDVVSLEKNIYKELGQLYYSIVSTIKNDYERSILLNKAKNNLEKSQTLFPNDIETNFALGVVYRRLGKDDFAKNIFNKLLAMGDIKSNKFFYNKVLNEYEIIMRKEYLESKPREMRVTITNECNIGCRYCDIWKSPDWQLSDTRMKEILDSFPYLENMYWLGGETFFYKGFEEILEEGSKYNTLNQTILTNGLLLNEKNLEKISKTNISLLIAIDAGRKETYEYLRRGASWEKLCKNLEMIKEVGQRTNKKIKTTFNAVISKSNYKEMFDMVEMAHKYDFNKIRFMAILGDSKENIFLNRDMEALDYIYDAIPLLKQKASEYTIDFEQMLPTKSLPYYKDINLNFVENGKNDLIKTNRNVIECVAPWKVIVLDSKGPMRTCVNCNDWLGDSKKQSINEFWNGNGMKFYRRAFGNKYTCKGGTYLSAGPNDMTRCFTCNMNMYC